MTLPYLVVIPFIHSEAQGNELEYAIRGWFKHFRDPFQMVVIGDVNPFVLANRKHIDFVAQSRVPEIPGQYRPHLDHVAKLQTVMRLYGGTLRGCIQAADDCYPINDFGVEDILTTKYADDQIPIGDICDKNGFWSDMEKTRRRLVDLGLPTHNWETHTPRYYDFARYNALVEEHDLRHQSYVVENLYFNTYAPDCALHLLPDNHLLQRLETQHEVIDPTRIWLSNSRRGWTDNLENFLKSHFNV